MSFDLTVNWCIMDYCTGAMNIVRFDHSTEDEELKLLGFCVLGSVLW